MQEQNIVNSLAALAHHHRLRIFRLLVDVDPPGMPASDIAERIGASLTNTSFHLRELSRAGLLRATREGRYIRYACGSPTSSGAEAVKDGRQATAGLS